MWMNDGWKRSCLRQTSFLRACLHASLTHWISASSSIDLVHWASQPILVKQARQLQFQPHCISWGSNACIVKNLMLLWAVVTKWSLYEAHLVGKQNTANMQTLREIWVFKNISCVLCETCLLQGTAHTMLNNLSICLNSLTSQRL